MNSTPSYPERSPALLVAVGGALAVVAIVLTAIIGFPAAVTVTPVGLSTPGCLDTIKQSQNGEIGRVLTVDADIAYANCNGTDSDQPTQERYSVKALVGGRARLELVAPNLNGSIKPVSAETQPIDSAGTPGTWSWEVLADKPGDYDLSLVLSIVSPDGKEVLLQNKRIGIKLHVPGTPGYYAGAAAKWVGDFVTTLAGVITTAVAAALAVWPLVLKLRRRKAKPEQDTSRSDGYL